MIFNIHGFQQANLIKMGLDNDDALILRAITGMYASAKMEHIIYKGDRYIWVNQDYLQRQVPVIGSKRTIVRRIEKMIKKGLLVSHTSHSKKGKPGTFYYIKPLPLLDSLRDIGPYDKMSQEGYDKMSQEGMTKCHSKDNIYNKDSLYNNKEYSASKESTTDINNFFEDMWKLYPNKKNKGQVSKSKKKEIYKLGDEFKRCIERYIKDVEEQRANGFTTLRYKNGSTFFNSGYIDYLDKNYKDTLESNRVNKGGNNEYKGGTTENKGESSTEFDEEYLKQFEGVDLSGI